MPDSDPSRLMLAIVSAFQEDVKAHGAEFIVVHMPAQQDLMNWDKTGAVPYLDLLDELDGRVNLVHTADEFDTDHLQDYFASLYGHYSSIGNRVIAEQVAAAILNHRDAPSD